jgi:hypothetical protein
MVTGLTLCIAPKPFRGLVATIQENALESVTNICPPSRIVLVGDEEGAAEAARRFDVTHLPDVDRNELGTPLLGSILGQVEALALSDTICFINADVLLFDDFVRAVELVRARFGRFLMAGRGWRLRVDTRLRGRAALDHARASAYDARDLRRTASAEYFVFSRGLFGDVPAFAIGRSGYDLWLLWRARAARVPVVDATSEIVAVHQNHDYSHVVGGLAAAQRSRAQPRPPRWPFQSRLSSGCAIPARERAAAPEPALARQCPSLGLDGEALAHSHRLRETALSESEFAGTNARDGIAGGP